MRKPLYVLVVGLLVASFLAGCGPTAAPSPAASPEETAPPVKEAVVVPAPAEEQEWEVLNPAGVRKVTPIELAPRIASLEGKTVGLKWNQKPNGNIFLDRIAELLQEQVPGVNIVKFWEVEPTTAPQSANIGDAQKKAQLVAKYNPDIVIGSQCD